jgi:hypothetical protein
MRITDLGKSRKANFSLCFITVIKTRKAISLYIITQSTCLGNTDYTTCEGNILMIHTKLDVI